IIPLGFVARDDVRGRGHSGRIDLPHLIGVGEKVAELLCKEIQLRGLELEIREGGDRLDFFSCECCRHDKFYNVRMATIRPAAVAGSWYPGSAQGLAAAGDRYLARATREVPGDLVALIAPHAGLKYSGPVAAHAYRLLRHRRFDVVILVGPSHFVGFGGVAVVRAGGFEAPFGVAPIDADVAEATAPPPPAVPDP